MCPGRSIAPSPEPVWNRALAASFPKSGARDGRLFRRACGAGAPDGCVCPRRRAEEWAGLVLGRSSSRAEEWVRLVLGRSSRAEEWVRLVLGRSSRAEEWVRLVLGTVVLTN